MNEIAQFLQTYAGVVNTALLLGIIGLGFRLFRAAARAKKAEVALLRAQLQVKEGEGVVGASEKFRALREYYEEHLGKWYQASLATLEAEKEKAVRAKEEEYRARLQREIERRRDLFVSLTKRHVNANYEIAPGSIQGEYVLVGHNPADPDSRYIGKLSIRADNEVLHGEWNLEPPGGSHLIRQRHIGTGIVVGRALALHFSYESSITKKLEHGVVLYEAIAPGVLRGRWTGIGILTTGFEECRKSDAGGGELAA